MTVAVPSLSPGTSVIMFEFEETAGVLMAKHQANREENISLSELRDTLLPKLMSGEIGWLESSTLNY